MGNIDNTLICDKKRKRLVKSTKITQKRLKELFYYEDGHLYCKVDRPPRAKKGVKIGCFDNDGYLIATVDNILHKVHRLIFLYHYGYLPKCLDHVNRIRDDNRIENLRKATNGQNKANADLQKNNISGYKGVCWSKIAKKWHAQIKVEQNRHHLGYFSSKKKASKAYNKAALYHFGEYANLNIIK